MNYILKNNTNKNEKKKNMHERTDTMAKNQITQDSSKANAGNGTSWIERRRSTTTDQNVTESNQIITSKNISKRYGNVMKTASSVVSEPPQQQRNTTNIQTAKSRKSNILNSYLMRLESIKYQILMKLGLKQKPNITSSVPKHVIMETLYRADDINMPPSKGDKLASIIYSVFLFCHFN